MPSYTYRCKVHNEVVEIEKGINEDIKVYCSKCASEGRQNCEMERVYASTNVNLNFSGSYNSTRKEKV